jgi:hypothetical protein
MLVLLTTPGSTGDIFRFACLELRWRNSHAFTSAAAVRCLIGNRGIGYLSNGSVTGCFPRLPVAGRFAGHKCLWSLGFVSTAPRHLRRHEVFKEEPRNRGESFLGYHCFHCVCHLVDCVTSAGELGATCSEQLPRRATVSSVGSSSPFDPALHG